MSADVWTALIAGASFMVLLIGSILTGVGWLSRQIKQSCDAIIRDMTQKHDENNRRYEALNVMVIRHDTWLNPDYSRVTGNSSREKHG